VNKKEVIEEVKRQLSAEVSPNFKRIIEKKYNRLCRQYTDDDLVYAILEELN
jgi:hypothetical protein